MGFGGISAWQLIIVLVIVLLIFGTKKLRGVGGDLGSAIKSFKKAVKEEPKSATAEDDSAGKKDDGENSEQEVIESTAADADAAAKPAASEKTI